MNEKELLRYSCQMALPGFGKAAQEQLAHASVLIVGMGGLGCPAAQYLAAAGIGTIGIVDHDVVSIGNLHRQILYETGHIGQKKVDVAAIKLREQNPQVSIKSYAESMSSDNVMALLAEYDIILDCTDNFETKYLLNDACVLQHKPLIFAAIYQYEGQLAIWNLKNEDGTYTPNYRDLFPEVDAALVPNCAEGGVLPTLAGIMGCMQASEAIKYFTNRKEILRSKILLFDARSMESRIIKLGAQTSTLIKSIRTTEVVPIITIGALKDEIANGAFELLDVRKIEERNAYDIGGKHIPLNELTARHEELTFNGPLVIYCASGKRSAEAVKQLLKIYPEEKIFSLEGGIKAWKEY